MSNEQQLLLFRHEYDVIYSRTIAQPQNEHRVVNDFLILEVVGQEDGLYDIIARNRPKLRNDIIDVELVALLQHEEVTLAVRRVRVDQPLQLVENITLLIDSVTSAVVSLCIAE